MHGCKSDGQHLYIVTFQKKNGGGAWALLPYAPSCTKKLSVLRIRRRQRSVRRAAAGASRRGPATRAAAVRSFGGTAPASASLLPAGAHLQVATRTSPHRCRCAHVAHAIAHYHCTLLLLNCYTLHSFTRDSSAQGTACPPIIYLLLFDILYNVSEKSRILCSPVCYFLVL